MKKKTLKIEQKKIETLNCPFHGDTIMWVQFEDDSKQIHRRYCGECAMALLDENNIHFNDHYKDK
jgi:hypothetical protein